MNVFDVSRLCLDSEFLKGRHLAVHLGKSSRGKAIVDGYRDARQIDGREGRKTRD